MSTSALAEFLLARIAEDEAWAEASASPDYSDAEPGTPAHSARILAECEAKRRIVEEHHRHDAGQRGYGATRYAVLCLAAVYADHPDYRPEWKV
jgi:hypothetical protein